jgi:hypothetical protein
MALMALFASNAKGRVGAVVSTGTPLTESYATVVSQQVIERGTPGVCLRMTQRQQTAAKWS